MRLNKVQKAAITALEDIKARDITVLDTRKLTSMYDALIIATADSARQTKALARHVHDKVKAAGGSLLSTEGEEGGEWVLVDCADFVVHIMLPAARALYDLESLWTAPSPTRKALRPTTAKATTAPTASSSRSNPATATRKKPAGKPAIPGTASRKKASSAAATLPPSKRPSFKGRARRRLPE